MGFIPVWGPTFTPSSHLKIFDLSHSVLANARLINTGAANHILSFLLFGPWVWLAASETLALDKATSSHFTTLGGVVSGSITLKSLFGNTWEGRNGPPWGWNHVELLATTSDTDNFEHVADTILSLDKDAKHICEEGTLSESCPGSSLVEVRLVDTKPFGKGQVNVIHKNTRGVNGVFF